MQATKILHCTVPIANAAMALLNHNDAICDTRGDTYDITSSKSCQANSSSLQESELNNGLSNKKDCQSDSSSLQKSARLGGTKPVLGQFEDVDAEQLYLIDQINRLKDLGKLGSAAVLHRHEKEADAILNLLLQQKIAAERILGTNTFGDDHGDNSGDTSGDTNSCDTSGDTNSCGTNSCGTNSCGTSILGPILVGTLASAKDLQFNTVFILGLNDGVVPQMHATMIGEEKQRISTERRLLFNGMTCARNRLYLLSGGTPSQFLKELDSTLFNDLKLVDTFSDELDSIDEVHQIGKQLNELVKNNPGAVTKRQDMRDLLMNTFPFDKKLCNTLMYAFDSGIVNDISSGKELDQVQQHRLIKILVDTYGIMNNIATKIILCWAICFNATLTTVPSSTKATPLSA
ncbi:MAG: hypothetical protein LBG97_02510 [Coriobacteriales bacterium]|jgi:hypothetical protein|nr:hypothetical protein [Coriobacteriales bacterium]